MFELICNIALFVFLGYTYFTHVLEAKVPKAYIKNPNVLYPSTWPKVIIILLLICIAVNVYKIIKKNKGNPEFRIGAPSFLAQIKYSKVKCLYKPKIII